MGAPWNNINRKTEDAFKAVIQAQFAQHLSGLQVVTGHEFAELESERIEIRCPTAEPETYADRFTGNWRVTVAIALVTNMEDKTRTNRKDMTGELFDAILDDELISWLNNQSGVPDFHAFGGNEGQGEGFELQSVSSDALDHSFIEVLTGTLYCKPSTGE